MAAATAAASPAGTEVGEIIVTAEKRAQSLQKVPEAVSAYTSNLRDKIGITTTADLANYTPGLEYYTGSDHVFLRGIGRQTYNLASEDGVATYYDGVYVAGATATAADPLFVQRTEVLRGPQGTLYGRNSIGGAINVISVRPTKDFYAEVRASFENYEHETVVGAVSGPINDSLRFRLAGYFSDQAQGYYTNVTGGPSEGNAGTRHTLEAQVDANLGSQVDFWLKASVSGYDLRQRTTVAPGADGPYDFGSPTTGIISGFLSPTGGWALKYGPGGFSPDPTKIANVVMCRGYTSMVNPQAANVWDFADCVPNHTYESDRPTFAYNLTWHLPFADVKYIGGYSAYEYHRVTDTGGNPVQSFTFLPSGNTYSPISVSYYLEDKSYFSNELNITSTNNGPVQWIVGAYQYREQYHQQVWYPFAGHPATITCRLIAYYTCDSTPAAPNPSNSIYDIGSYMVGTSYAGFAQVDWKLNDLLKFTGGVRYTADHKGGYELTRQFCWGLTAAYLCPSLITTPNGQAVDVTQMLIRGATYKNAAGNMVPYPGVTYAPVLNPATGYWSSGLGDSWSAPTGTAGVEFTPDRQSLYYAKYSHGYKAGGFNANPVGVNPLTGEESVDAYEIGLKKDFGRTFRVNASAFYYNYDGMQTPVSFYPVAGPTQTATVNLKQVVMDGVELEATWQPIENLQILANYAYLSAIIHAPCAPTGPDMANCFVDLTDPGAYYPGANKAGPIVGVNQAQSVNGQTVPGSPKNKISINVNYTFRLEPGDLNFSASYIWKDATYASIFNRAYNLAPAYDQVDLRATWTDKSDRYTVIAYVRNALDTVGYESRTGDLLAQALGNPTTPGGLSETLALTPPRVFGLELQYRFK